MRKFTSQFQQNQYYIEAFNSEGVVFFGRKENLQEYRNDLTTNGINSIYYRCIFYPEGINPDYEYDYEDNKAFWAGIMDSKRSLILETDINAEKLRFGWVCDEILWLYDNNYRFISRPTQNNPTQILVVPPDNYQQQPFVDDYRNKIHKRGALTYSIRQYQNVRWQKFEEVLSCIEPAPQPSYTRPSSP
jgi:hypothetical protein